MNVQNKEYGVELFSKATEDYLNQVSREQNVTIVPRIEVVVALD